MGLGRTLKQRWSATFGPRTRGFPTSSNAASSFHLRWLGLPSDEPVLEVSVTLEIVEPPVVPRLYFWALQASFVDRGRPSGAGHLGLQWYAAHPDSTAANWGGYGADGRELTGSASALPSATGNPNTRDFPWLPQRPYRLAISAGSQPGEWQGSIDGQIIRELHGDGTALTDVMVWSEVFARCDDPSVVVRWSDLRVRTATGLIRPDRVAVSYQSKVDGGCDNTSIRVTGDGIEQITNASRAVPPAAVLAL